MDESLETIEQTAKRLSKELINEEHEILFKCQKCSEWVDIDESTRASDHVDNKFYDHVCLVCNEKLDRLNSIFRRVKHFLEKQDTEELNDFRLMTGGFKMLVPRT